MELHLQGYLNLGHGKELKLSKSTNSGSYVDICEEIENFFGSKIRKNKKSAEFDDNETELILDNVSIQIYWSNKECSLEEGINTLISILDGELLLNYCEFGYSEFSVLGLNVTKFKIGNHDLIDVLTSMKEKYINMLIKIED